MLQGRVPTAGRPSARSCSTTESAPAGGSRRRLRHRSGPAPAPLRPPGAATPGRARGTARSQNGGGGRSASGGCEQAGIGEDGGGWSVRAGRAGARMGLLRLGPGPVLAAGLGDAARRCHHPLGGHRGREDPAAGERPEGCGALPTQLRRHGEPLSAPSLTHSPGLPRATGHSARGEALPVPAAAAAAGRRCRSLPRPRHRGLPQRASVARETWLESAGAPGRGIGEGRLVCWGEPRMDFGWSSGAAAVPACGRSREPPARGRSRCGGESSGTAAPARNRDPSGAGPGQPRAPRRGEEMPVSLRFFTSSRARPGRFSFQLEVGKRNGGVCARCRSTRTPRGFSRNVLF